MEKRATITERLTVTEADVAAAERRFQRFDQLK
jgi:hypothetical protein